MANRIQRNASCWNGARLYSFNRRCQRRHRKKSEHRTRKEDENEKNFGFEKNGRKKEETNQRRLKLRYVFLI